MQRKNHLLNHKMQHRNGMAMIMAIAVIVVLSTIMALSLSLTNQTTKRTTDVYIHEQAILLSKSATEYALLEMSQSQNCLTNGGTNFNFTHDSIYDINITARYITDGITGCEDYIDNIQTPEQNGSVLLDVTVSVNDPSITTEPVRFFRRSIQKL